MRVETCFEPYRLERFAYIQRTRLQLFDCVLPAHSWVVSSLLIAYFSSETYWSRQAASLLDPRMFRKKKKKRPEISAPKNFEHRVHTSFDAKRGCFVGLPTQWQSLIENLRRPRPMVDPSRITEVELRPKKVCHTFIFRKVHFYLLFTVLSTEMLFIKEFCS